MDRSPPKRKGRSGGSFKDVAGQRQAPPGRLTALRFLGRWGGHSWWRCRCRCGRFKTVSLWAFRNLNTKSCGCLQRELARAKGKARRRPEADVEEMVRHKRMGFTYEALGRLFRLSPKRVCHLVKRWLREHPQGRGEWLR